MWEAAKHRAHQAAHTVYRWGHRHHRLAIMAGVLGAMMLHLMLGSATHKAMMRWMAHDKVFLVTTTEMRIAGTAFQVEAPSGQTYLLTNDHICQEAKDGNLQVMLGDRPEQGMVPRRIVKQSELSDLCLVEAMPGVAGLKLGSETHVGKNLFIVGHPAAKPLTVTTGEVTGSKDVEIAMSEITTPEEEAACSMPKNKIREIEVGFMGIVLGRIKLCTATTKDARITDVTIFPGSSGSPVLDWRGRVVGVAFASDRTNWALIVNLHDIETLLAPY